MKMRFVHIVADYGEADPAFGEVIQRLRAYGPDITTYPTSVPPFDTLSTGFWIYQYGMGEHPEGMFIYSNTAPRKDNKRARDKNAGEIFMYGKLENGTEIMAVNAGNCFSFVKPHLVSFREVKVENMGSQFRSRDFYPKVAADHMLKKDVLGEEVSTDSIPEIPENKIAWIDGYGNIKTSIRKSRLILKPGEKVTLTINGIARTALVAGGNFYVNEGELSFSPGSSGYDDPFYELFLRGGSAEQLFNFPRAGAKIKLAEPNL
jgi:hypothetical protein